jgi:hypothetical protein
VFEQYYEATLETLHAYLLLQQQEVLNHICIACYLEEIMHRPDSPKYLTPRDTTEIASCTMAKNSALRKQQNRCESSLNCSKIFAE